MVFAAIQNEKDRTKAEALYYEYRRLMYKEAYEILKDKMLAEDAVSESFIRIMSNLHKIDEKVCPRTRNFLVIICRNVAKSMYNARKSELTAEYVENIGNIPTPEDIVITKETKKAIVKIVSSLSPKYKDVLILRRAYNMSREDIANIFQISVETVKKRLQRAKAMILKELEKENINEKL